MRDRLQILIGSDDPVSVEGLSQRLGRGPNAVECRSLADPIEASVRRDSHQAIVMLAPHSWKEMRRWLDELKAKFPKHPG